MNNADHLKLAERCEQASGPDEQLDFDIAEALELQPTGWASRKGKCSTMWPRVTASLDAAMTLVPEGHQFGIEHFPWCDHPAGKSAAWVGNGGDSGIEQTGRIVAATPALALCAAALRASSERTQGER